jgi:hypothetical protein
VAVSRSYKMPCNKLDLADIEAATAAVAASFPGVTRTVEANDPRCISCTFLIPLELARQWHNNQINWVGDEDLPPGPIPVQVDFQHLPADSNSAQDLFLMSIDAGYPATNGLCWWTAAEIVERLCRHWGNRCELL